MNPLKTKKVIYAEIAKPSICETYLHVSNTWIGKRVRQMESNDGQRR